MKLMSLRRFTRGGYRDLDGPVSLRINDEVIGTFTPGGRVSAAPGEPVVPTSPSAAAISPVAPTGTPSRSAMDAAYRKVAGAR